MIIFPSVIVDVDELSLSAISRWLQLLINSHLDTQRGDFAWLPFKRSTTRLSLRFRWHMPFIAECAYVTRIIIIRVLCWIKVIHLFQWLLTCISDSTSRNIIRFTFEWRMDYHFGMILRYLQLNSTWWIRALIWLPQEWPWYGCIRVLFPWMADIKSSDISQVF